MVIHLVAIFEGCDCAGVFWTVQPELPATVYMGSTTTYTFTPGYDSLKTPSCAYALKKCHPTMVSVTLQNGDPVPSFITVLDHSITVEPT